MLTKKQKEILDEIVEKNSCNYIGCGNCYNAFGEGEKKHCYDIGHSKILVEKAKKLVSNSMLTSSDEEQIILNQTN